MRATIERRVAVAAATGLVLATTLAGCGGRARPAAGAAPASATGPQGANTVTAADMSGQQPSARRVEDLFQGRFPGVQAHAAQGGIVIQIRGGNFSGNGAPLYVIDGQPVSTGSDGLVAINPSDVARIEVVKDAAELAMWGSRSGNGVVKITTKRPGRR